MGKFLLLLLGVFILFCACEDEAKNPGNYNLKSELNIIDVTTKNGTDISLNVFRSIDSTYVRFYEKNDTLKDESGKPILGEDGKYIVTKDTIYYKGNITAKFIEFEKIILDSPADTIYVSLESNAKWLAPMPSAGGKVQWFFTQRLAGGGDGTIIAAVTRNRNKRRAIDAVQYVYTSDSTVMCKLTFNQIGENE